MAEHKALAILLRMHVNGICPELLLQARHGCHKICTQLQGHTNAGTNSVGKQHETCSIVLHATRGASANLIWMYCRAWAACTNPVLTSLHRLSRGIKMEGRKKRQICSLDILLLMLAPLNFSLPFLPCTLIADSAPAWLPTLQIHNPTNLVKSNLGG